MGFEPATTMNKQMPGVRQLVICAVAVTLLFALYRWIIPLMAAVLALVVYVDSSHGYWRRRGVAHPPTAHLVGNLWPLLRSHVSFAQHLASVYWYAPACKYAGYYSFGQPILVLRDLELIKAVFVKDFEAFPSRITDSKEHVDPLGRRALFAVRAPKWRPLRAQLSPAFTTSRLKALLPELAACYQDLCNVIAETSADSGSAIPMRELLARSSTDVVMRALFGVRGAELKGPRSAFRHYGRQTFKFTPWRAFEILGVFFSPNFGRLGNFYLFGKEPTEFFFNAFMEIMQKREESGHPKREDLLDRIMKLKSLELPDATFDDSDAVAQAAMFFAAGFETTSITICNALFELAMNPDIQETLRTEIREAVESNGYHISYDVVRDMKYLDMVVSESLRKYPSLPFADRRAGRRYQLPGTELTLDAGTPVFAPILAIHHDPRYYPQPERFDPQRFSEDVRRTRPSAAYMPFGLGPHNCIGKRFGLLSTKMALVHILREFVVTPAEGTPRSIKINRFSFFLCSEGEIPLHFHYIHKKAKDHLTSQVG